MAYARLGIGDRNLNEPTLGIEPARKAYELRERVGELERFYIESHYYEIVSGNVENGHCPVPLKYTVWGLLLESSFSTILAVLVPTSLGVKVA